MENYKMNFINLLLDSGALRIGEELTLKSGRVSPWFVNLGDISDGESIKKGGWFYARALKESEEAFDILYGIPEKGKPIATATAIALHEMCPEKSWPFFSTRKESKNYGEYSNLNIEEIAKSLVIGKTPENGQRIAQLDDVFTDGGAKYDARRTLESLGNFKYPVLVISVDRQEVDSNGRDAIAEYEENEGTRVISIVNASEIYDYLKNHTLLPVPGIGRMADYLMKYGTNEAKGAIEILR